jgi:hypothetical protein
MTIPIPCKSVGVQEWPGREPIRLWTMLFSLPQFDLIAGSTYAERSLLLFGLQPYDFLSALAAIRKENQKKAALITIKKKDNEIKASDGHGCSRPAGCLLGRTGEVRNENVSVGASSRRNR